MTNLQMIQEGLLSEDTKVLNHVRQMTEDVAAHLARAGRVAVFVNFGDTQKHL